MTMLHRLGCLATWFAVAVFVIAASVSNRVAGQETDESPDLPEPPPAKQAAKDDPNSPNYSLPREHKAEVGADELAAIKEKLEAAVIKPPHSKKADDDFFIIGTIDLENHHAVVDFVIKQGVQATAEFLADFDLGKKRGVVREWRVFGRAKNMKVAEVLRAKAKSELIEDQLNAFKVTPSGNKKSPDDYFVVGTANLDTMTQNADIRFEVITGVKKAADFLIDFIFNQPKFHKGEWHVFFRAHTEAKAIAYRQEMRDQYDAMEAERAELAAIYNAKTTRRC